MATKWHQFSPYNNLIGYNTICSNNPNGKPVAGCVAIAIGQVMAYHKYPAAFGGVTYNWSKMINPSDSASRNMAASLIASIGRLVDMDYGCDGSEAYSSETDDCFDDMGYSTPSKYQDYNLNKVISSIANRKPVCTDGYAIKVKEKVLGFTYNTYYKKGHAWVIDGYTKRSRPVTRYVRTSTKTTKTTSTQTEEYVNCNWGWGATDNGWYLNKVFDTNKSDITLKSGTERYYQYKLKILPDVSK